MVLLSETQDPEVTKGDAANKWHQPVESTWSKGKTVVQKAEFSSTNSKGGWKTMPFLVGNEICERMGSLSVLWNLIPFLYSKYNMNYVRAGYIVNAISGTCSFTPLVGAFLADSYFGRYSTILASSFFTLVGLVLLSTAAYVKNLHAPHCSPASPAAIDNCPQASSAQFGFLTVAFIFIAIGSGGLRSCTYAFGADQFDASTPQGAKRRQKFFNWFYFFTCLSLLIGLTLIVYIQSNISWGLGYLILAIAMLVAIILFFSGTALYRHVLVDGNSYTSLAQVLVAAIRKRKWQLPSDPSKLYEIGNEGEARLPHTEKLRYADKAAIMLEGDVEEEKAKGKANAWRLCTVHQVEEFKAVVNLLPVWSCFILYNAVQVQLGNLTVGQAYVLNMKIGNFPIPPASIGVVPILTFLAAIPVYDSVLLPVARKLTKNPRGISFLWRMSIGVVLLAATFAVAGLIERKRRNASNIEGVQLGFIWLLPQSSMIGVAETFAAIGQNEMFYEQLPPGMRSMSGALFWLAFAFGSYGANLIQASAQHSSLSRNWLSPNLNQGHLDYYFFLLACLVLLDLLLLLLAASRYTYVHHIEPSHKPSPSPHSYPIPKLNPGTSPSRDLSPKLSSTPLPPSPQLPQLSTTTNTKSHP